MQVSTKAFYPLLFALVAIVGMIMGAKLRDSLKGDGLWVTSTQVSDRDASIDQALGYIRERYYGDLDDNEFSEEVVSGMIDELDQYSSYFDPVADDRYDHYIDGAYQGRGFDLHSSDRGHFITKVFEGSSAAAVALRRGDQITGINGLPTGEMTRDSLSGLMAASDSITLSILRADDDKTVTLSRGRVVVPIVVARRFADTDLLFIKISRFSKGVFTEVMDILDGYKKSGIEIKKIVFDLRGNPGGLLDEVIKVVNQLVQEPNITLLSTKNKKGKGQTYESNGRVFFTVDRVVCIVDEYSASASEIMAGSLQDLDKAVIIGQRSFGKGYIQQNFNLANGSSINLTVGEYLLPTGRAIRRTSDSTTYRSLGLQRKIVSDGGITPDVEMADSCDISYRWLSSHIIPVLIDEGLLAQEVLVPADITRVVETVSTMHQSDCKAQIGADVRAFLFDLYLSNADNVTADGLDYESGRAIDIITTGEYDSILK